MFELSKDVGSSPVAFKFFFVYFFFFDLLVFILDLGTTGYMYIYLNLACVYVTNTTPRIIFNKLTCD